MDTYYSAEDINMDYNCNTSGRGSLPSLPRQRTQSHSGPGASLSPEDHLSPALSAVTVCPPASFLVIANCSTLNSDNLQSINQVLSYDKLVVCVKSWCRCAWCAAPRPPGRPCTAARRGTWCVWAAER